MSRVIMRPPTAATGSPDKGSGEKSNCHCLLLKSTRLGGVVGKAKVLSPVWVTSSKMKPKVTGT